MSITLEKAKKQSIKKWRDILLKFNDIYSDMKSKCGFCIRYKLGTNMVNCEECEANFICDNFFDKCFENSILYFKIKIEKLIEDIKKIGD